ncbi:porin [Methylomicrobium sp. Wu6]|uniref:porin n=1 Tax=Methylomicrobium sp. Wu6 TaxID=3107928 RepID=UPI002DD6493E|nr:porin [Methylomicrobium sp. Wu6]MEC4749630.1 porin [Methylomicrobium sp. Wu6]
MKHFKRTAIASVINLALFGIPDAHADTEALERRIRELESRLEKLDHAGVLSNKPVTSAPEVEKLTRKVNTLERKLEVQDEVTASTFSKLPVFDAGADGFKITSADKEHQVRIRGAVQADGRFFIDDNSKAQDSKHNDLYRQNDRFEIRQARIWLEGYFFKNIFYKIMPDFAAGSNILPDAYLDYAYHPAASLLVGKYKPSISLERLQGDSDGTFLERGFPTYLAPNRDVGIQLHGAFSKPGYKTETVAGPIDSKNTFIYQIGVTNGTGDDGSPNNDAKDTDDNKEIDGRLFAHPFQHTGYSWLEGFGLGVAGSVGNPNKQALKPQSTPIGRSIFLDYTKVNSGFATPTSDGATYRIYPQAYWYSGPFGAIGEYVVSSQHLVSGNTNVKQNNTAWQILASYVVTGEDNSFSGVKPIRNFDPFNGRWGALQLAARYTQLDVDNDTFRILDPNKSASGAKAWTIGANWFLNSNAIIRADYENVSFDGGAAKGGNRPNEQVFATRFQLAF